MEQLKAAIDPKQTVNFLKNVGTKLDFLKLRGDSHASLPETPPDLVLTRESFAPPKSDKPNDEIFRSIPEEFKQEEFDAALYVLQNLPDVVDEQVLEREIALKMRAMDIIDSKLSDVIMLNYKSFVAGMHRIQEFGNDLKYTTLLLKSGRHHLQTARSKITSGGIMINTKVKRNRILNQLADDIGAMKGLLANNQLAESAIEEGDFPKAIDLCIRCQQDISRYQQFVSLRGMTSRFQEAFEKIEEKLENSLLLTCKAFNPEKYEKILIGFKQLGKVNKVSELFQVHLSYLVDTLSHDAVLQYVLKSKASTPNFNPERTKKTPFKELCSMLNEDQDYLPCLRQVLETNCNLMLNLHSIIKWHESGEFESIENMDYFDDMQGRLKKIRRNLWEEIQRKTSAFVGAKPLSNFSFEDFLTVLNLINKLITIGDDFTGVASPTLRNAVKQHSVSYFNSYQKQRMEDLRAMLENDSWRPCPVQPGFSIKTLKEFDFSKNVLLPPPASTNNEDSKAFEKYNLELIHSIFAETVKQRKDIQEEAPHNEEEEVAEELRQDYIDETGEKPNSAKDAAKKAAKKPTTTEIRGPVLSSTTINLIKLIGKYISMMEVLSPIASDVLAGLTQVVEYYLYAAFKFFTSDVVSKNMFVNDPNKEPEKINMHPKLRGTLSRLHEKYDDEEGTLEIVFSVPKVSSLVDLKTQATLFGLAERITACESLVFFENVLRTVKDKLERLIPAARRANLSQFYSQTVDIILELRNFIYQCVSRKLVDFDQVLAAMSKVNWERKEVGTDHSPYVDVLIREFKQFKNRLDTNPYLREVPKEILVNLWRLTIINAMEVMVDGFATPKKCNDQGRAAMQLDFKIFVSSLEKLTDIRPIPHTQFVETYIKAYYITEEEAENWIKEHREYNAKQLMSVILLGVGNRGQKQKKRFTTLIEELEKTRK